MSAKADRARSDGRSIPSGGAPSGSPLRAALGVTLRATLVAVLWTATSAASAQTRTVMVTNQSSATVREIYIDDAEGKAPGGNRLRNTLPPNARASITYSQGCRANVRIVLDDRTVQEHRGADVCAQSAFAVTGGQAARPPGQRGSGAAASASRVAPPGASGAGAARGGSAAPPPEPVPWTGRSITKKLTLDGYR